MIASIEIGIVLLSRYFIKIFNLSSESLRSAGLTGQSPKSATLYLSYGLCRETGDTALLKKMRFVFRGPCLHLAY